MAIMCNNITTTPKTEITHGSNLLAYIEDMNFVNGSDDDNYLSRSSGEVNDSGKVLTKLV